MTTEPDPIGDAPRARPPEDQVTDPTPLTAEQEAFLRRLVTPTYVPGDTVTMGSEDMLSLLASLDAARKDVEEGVRLVTSLGKEWFEIKDIRKGEWPTPSGPLLPAWAEKNRAPRTAP